MISVALSLIGFSLFSVVLLGLTHFRENNYEGQTVARYFGIVLIFELAGLQLAHWGWLYLDRPWVMEAPYRVLLFSVAPTFWAFSQPLLRGGFTGRCVQCQLLHGLPLFVAPGLSTAQALLWSFGVGAGYLVALAYDLYQVRAQRDQYMREIWLLGLVFALAVGVAVLGLVQVQLPDKFFYVFYAAAIGAAFLLVQIALGLRPSLSVEVTESVKSTYTVSTLSRVDREASLAKMVDLMEGERLFVDPELSLASLAARLGLTSHQLSELLNTSLGKSFSRYVRELRVVAAKTMLKEEPSASVLSVGLGVGFNTQSNFYEAFREIEGMTPGQYRKLDGGQSRVKAEKQA